MSGNKYGVTLIAVLLLTGCSGDTDFCNCIHVENEGQFVGKRLKFSGLPKQAGTIKLADCISLDNAIDGGDGKLRGRVRWAECWGPDCNEAGMF